MQKRILPHVAAVAIFALLTIIFFLPYYQGMTLNQGDVTQWEGMSHEITEWNKSHPDDPALWTNSLFGGMPAIQISMVFTGNFVNKIVHFLQLIFPDAAILVFLMFVGFYILLLCLEVDTWLSVAGALAYGLSSFVVISIDAGHNTKVQAMALMAPVLGGMLLTYRKNILLGAAVTAFFVSMLIDANHLQVAYYVLMILGVTGIYFLVESILQKTVPHFAKATGALLIAAVIAILPNTANLWGTQEYAKETIRGGSSELTQKKKDSNGGLDYDYASRWSYGFTDGEILSILIPDIKGGGSSNTLSEDNKLVQKFAGGGYPIEQVKKYVGSIMYWGNQPFTSGPVYFGAAIVFLFIFSLLFVKNNFKWALLFLTIFSIFLAFGHNSPVHKWMFNLLPFFNKFRNPSMALVIAQLCMPLLALLGLNQLLTEKFSADDILKKLKISGGITAGIVILFGVIGSFMFTYSGAGDAELSKNNAEIVSLLKPERASMLRGDSFRALFFIAAAFALVWYYVKGKLTKQIFVASAAVLFLADGWLVAKRYLNSENFVEKTEYQNNHRPSAADAEILKDPDPYYRVFNITNDPFNDAMTSYYHKSVGGYHAAKLIRYQDLIENQISKNNINVLNMLNTKYVIVQNKENKQPQAQRNPGALGNAWFVREIKWVKNADEEMDALTNFDARNTVVVDERYKKMVPDNSIGSDSTSTIRLLSYSPNKLTYASNSTSNQVAVFSEIFYDEEKGWHAYLDGKPVEHFRANYVLRAMVLPAGTHQIEFRFEPKSIVTGNKIAYAGSFLLFAFVFGTLGFAGYKRMKEIEAEPKPEVKQATAPAPKPSKKK